ncbi:hypothetical protein U9R90_10945 [Streptomyces sp. E11-3]|uniref:hypothetical protein n=1 Tax=Streptomyces sp. E11-3 TaxID=3110112 RepID=UPI00397FC8A3
MSIPGSQPNPYQHNPHQQQPGAAASPNPYQQQPVPGEPHELPPLVLGGPPPVEPPPPARKPLTGWQWALGGAVVASALWAGTLFATGTIGNQADLRGYRLPADLCETTSHNSLLKRYKFESDTKPTSYNSEQEAIDQSQCSRGFTDRESSRGDEYSTSGYLSATATWHKKADPEPEFASTYKAYEDQMFDGFKYKVKSVGGLGDEAYVVTETQDEDDDDDPSSIILAVRDGWFTYQVRWASFSNDSDESAPPSPAAVVDTLKSDTRATLAALKNS